MSALSFAPGTLGYERALEWKETPSPEELAWCGWSVVRAVGRPSARWSPLARLGGVRLYLCPPGTARDAATFFSEPLVADKRGTPARGGYVGVDGQVRTNGFYPAPATKTAATEGASKAASEPAMPAAPVPIVPARFARARHRRDEAREVRVAVLDVGFENLDVLAPFGAARVDGPFCCSPLMAGSDSIRTPSRAPGHGTAMAGIVLHEVAAARVGLFRIPSIAGAVPAYTGPTEIAVALAAAIESWRADVVLIAMSDGAWGTPRHLRELLREAARTGRGARGTAIVCSVGDPAKNHSRAEDSAAIGADDLASQPWVIAAAACDAAGRWQRARFDYQDACSPGATYNRFGPSVALTAPGEARVYGGVLAADDSSQAAALVAAGAAAVLHRAPETTVDDLRAILNLSADVAGQMDGDQGLAASVCDGRDRAGHSFKVGYGRINVAAATLVATDPIAVALFATRRCPDPSDGGKSFAQHMAEAWEMTCREALTAAPPVARLASGYARVRGRLARAVLRAPAAGDALAWLARHARAIGEEPHERWLAGWEDHGALPDRLQQAADALGCALAGDVVATAWLDRFGAALARGRAGHVAAVLAEVLRRARFAADLQTSHDFSTDGRGPVLSTSPAVYHPACFAKGTRSPGCSGGGDAGGESGGDHRRFETS